jgi:hypothetical protein
MVLFFHGMVLSDKEKTGLPVVGQILSGEGKGDESDAIEPL